MALSDDQVQQLSNLLGRAQAILGAGSDSGGTGTYRGTGRPAPRVLPYFPALTSGTQTVEISPVDWSDTTGFDEALHAAYPWAKDIQFYAKGGTAAIAADPKHVDVVVELTA